jgi:zinc dependent phospholipase C
MGGTIGSRARRWAFIGLVAVAFPLVAAPSPASAWGNDGQEGPADAFGTHDWILHRALAAVGSDAAWVVRTVALRASDDPDSVDGLSHASEEVWHHYDEWGATHGKAPEATRFWYGRTAALLADGRLRQASRALGITSHFVADVAQPMHTDNSSAAEPSTHSPYENEVDARSGRRDGVYTFAYDGVDAATPYNETVEVARASHPYYDALINAFAASGYSAEVHSITQRQLNLAANAVADLISALP